MQSYADSAYEEYTDAYHWSVHIIRRLYMDTSIIRLHILHMQSLRDTVYYILSRSVKVYIYYKIIIYIYSGWYIDL